MHGSISCCRQTVFTLQTQWACSGPLTVNPFRQLTFHMEWYHATLAKNKLARSAYQFADWR